MLDPNDSKTTPFAFFNEPSADVAAPLIDDAVAVAGTDAEPQALSGAARQKKLRAVRKAKGIKPLHVSPDERELLGKALRLLEHVSVTDERAGGDVSALLKKVVPAGCSEETLTTLGQWEQRQKVEGLRTVQLSADEDCLLFTAFSALFTARADLEYLASPLVQDQLGRIFQDSPIWTEKNRAELDQDQGIINGAKYIEKESKRGWKAYESEREARSQLRAQLVAAQREITELKAAILEVAADLDTPGQTIALPPSSAALQAEIAGLRRECELLEAERNKAFAAAKVFESRLRLKGLSTDYRTQPGE